MSVFGKLFKFMSVDICIFFMVGIVVGFGVVFGILIVGVVFVFEVLIIGCM